MVPLPSSQPPVTPRGRTEIQVTPAGAINWVPSVGELIAWELVIRVMTFAHALDVSESTTGCSHSAGSFLPALNRTAESIYGSNMLPA